jgi:hypothetical protein
MLAAAFLLPLEVKKKTAGKNSQPVLRRLLQHSSEVLQHPNKAISPSALQPFKPED